MVSGRRCAAIALLIAWPLTAETTDSTGIEDATADRVVAATGVADSAAERLRAGIREEGMRQLAGEILERSPVAAALEARASAAAARFAGADALPDPVASLTAFVAPPETRTGPQRVAVGISQGLPGFGKRELRREFSELEARLADALVEARRLQLLTEGRRLYYELAFLDRYREITREFHAHLERHEEIARARYSTGVGLGQGVVKLQAEITRVEGELLEIERRRAALTAQLNALRDRPALHQLPEALLPEAPALRMDVEAFSETALARRPEIVRAEADIDRAEVARRLAEKVGRPDFRVGLSWTVVAPRDDVAGRLQPPEGNGDDIIAIQGGVTLPLWRRKVAAAVDQAEELEQAAISERRAVAAEIRAEISELAQSVPLSWRRLRLIEDLLIVQAEETVESSQAGYSTGTLNALDLFDAEHVLFEARTAHARATADYLIELARLEGAIAGPLERSFYETERFES